jgi:four helix bundle protein
VKIRSFTELEVWQKTHELALTVYKLTRTFPTEEQFGLVAQLRRASSSAAANIAEGFGRRTTNELLHSLRIANGEAEEARYFSLLSRDLGYIKQQDFENINERCESIARLLSALGRSLRNSSSPVTSYQSRVTPKGRSK